MRTVPSTAANTGELHSMSEAECLRRLSHRSFGRLAIAVDGQPLIFPVNYAMCQRVISIRTAAGTKLTYAPGAPVAFEIDGFDTSSGNGWSVLVQGRAIDATTALDDVSWAARGANPHPAAPGPHPYRIAIDAHSITGRRFGPRHSPEQRPQ